MVENKKLDRVYHTLKLAAIYRKLSGYLVPLIGLGLKYYGSVDYVTIEN